MLSFSKLRTQSYHDVEEENFFDYNFIVFFIRFFLILSRFSRFFLVRKLNSSTDFCYSLSLFPFFGYQNLWAKLEKVYSFKQIRCIEAKKLFAGEKWIIYRSLVKLLNRYRVEWKHCLIMPAPETYKVSVFTKLLLALRLLGNRNARHNFTWNYALRLPSSLRHYIAVKFPENVTAFKILRAL